MAAAPTMTPSTPLTGYERVTFTRRFFGDNILESILFFCTLGIGWFIWLAIVAPKGQSPVKSLLGVYIVDDKTGALATAGQVWLREFVGKWVIYLMLSAVGFAIAGQNGSNIASLYSLIGAIMILASSDQRAIWDYVGGTRIVRYPNGINAAATLPSYGMNNDVATRLTELDKLRELGAVTDVEYMERRRKILDSI